MGKTTWLTAALFAVVVFSSSERLAADEVTFFGDFADGFGSAATYSTFDSPDSGFVLAFDEPIVGIPKFDPSLGTLTDITVFVEDTDPITYDIGGGLSVAEIDPMEPGGFFGDVFISADVGINYEDPSGTSLTPVITDFLDLAGVCSGGPGEGGCGDGVFHGEDGILEGSESVFGFVDPADFIGPGSVDSLFVQLFVPTTAMFTTSNADADADVGFDIFAGISAPPVDSIVGVTYTFTPVPEPTSLLLAVPALALLGGRRRRK